MIHYSKDTDHIATLTLDMTGRQVNILNHEIVEAFAPVLEHLKKEKQQGKLRGVIITSAKKTFLAGGDLEYLSNARNAQAIFNFSEKLKGFFRDLERPGVPVVAAINGSALSTGFELALACHHRIALDHPEVKVGLPEVNFGLMPGNGGVIRTLWLLGIEKAFELLTEGRDFSPAEAYRAGIIDELANNETELKQKARNWLMITQEGCRPWDLPHYGIPGGSAKEPATARLIARLAAGISARWKGNFPAPQAILNTLAEGSKVGFDTACRIESRYYTALLTSKESKNMIQALWFDANTIAAGSSRPKGFGKFRPRKVGIAGAGVMGSGIAAACLFKGLEVVLKDVSRIIAERGKEQVASMLGALTDRGVSPPSQNNSLLERLRTTETAADFSDCDLVIESVFENLSVKNKVIKETEEHLDEYAFLASNTVSIPITRLAEKSSRPEQFIGLHFFRPAETTPLVEIVRGKLTGDETIAKAFDFVSAIGKTPVVVKDDWGFYVARVQNTYILEGITLLQEGCPPAVIENLGLQAGMPTGPLSLADDLSLQLVLRYEQQAAEHYGSRYIQHPAVGVLRKMLEELHRPGAAKKAGFYEYDDTGSRLWEGLNEYFPAADNAVSFSEIIERYLFAQVIEAVWCLQEGVVQSVPEANLGSIYGWGFPSFKGGVIQFIHDYGIENFLCRCEELQRAFGQRFKAPKWVKMMLSR